MTRQRIIAWGRVAVSLVVLIVVLKRAHLSNLDLDWNRSSIGFLVAALVVTFAGVVLSAVRWQKVLNALELRARIGTLLRHHLAGLFVSSFLPSTVGGDVLRGLPRGQGDRDHLVRDRERFLVLEEDLVQARRERRGHAVIPELLNEDRRQGRGGR